MDRDERMRHARSTTRTGARALAPVAPVGSSDALTGLPGRGFLLERTAELRTAGVPAALLVLDLDDFTTINVSLGSAAGDALLQQVAERLAGCLRGGDTLSRLGDDEFAVLCPGVADAGQAARLAERLHAVFDQPVHVAGQPVAVSASLGIAVAADDCDADLLLRRAGLALRQAKAGGRDRLAHYSDEAHVAVERRLNLVSGLRSAVDHDSLSLAYQPLVDLTTGEVRGAEALLRWRHPQLGSVSPALLVELAEATGLIGRLGDWVLRTSCRQLADWRASGVGPQAVSVNVSALQLTHPEFPGRVRSVLEEHGVPPAALCLEVTERMLMAADGAETRALAGLRELGVQVAIDDFGTGYSSLAYLKQLPVDVVKIARPFVSGMTTDPRDRAIVEAIITLARALGLAVVAEGVETAAQRDALRAFGCEVAQGYLLGRPEPCAA